MQILKVRPFFCHYMLGSDFTNNPHLSGGCYWLLLVATFLFQKLRAVWGTRVPRKELPRSLRWSTIESGRVRRGPWAIYCRYSGPQQKVCWYGFDGDLFRLLFDFFGDPGKKGKETWDHCRTDLGSFGEHFKRDRYNQQKLVISHLKPLSL